ncbi:hypothetical protein TGFOU_248510B [Toxoplasma gondii FOU]|uniref:Uncharacterized protein n=2 Tax=Toxoplasma gondii TaxID=5811 RepID=A0A086LBU3_TOXGO|nr:hypothetical protein TGFOU_248510B [Toxoplasma gondii FOU]
MYMSVGGSPVSLGFSLRCVFFFQDWLCKLMPHECQAVPLNAAASSVSLIVRMQSEAGPVWTASWNFRQALFSKSHPFTEGRQGRCEILTACVSSKRTFVCGVKCDRVDRGTAVLVTLFEPVTLVNYLPEPISFCVVQDYPRRVSEETLPGASKKGSTLFDWNKPLAVRLRCPGGLWSTALSVALPSTTAAAFTAGGLTEAEDHTGRRAKHRRRRERNRDVHGLGKDDKGNANESFLFRGSSNSSSRSSSRRSPSTSSPFVSPDVSPLRLRRLSAARSLSFVSPAFLPSAAAPPQPRSSLLPPTGASASFPSSFALLPSRAGPPLGAGAPEETADKKRTPSFSSASSSSSVWGGRGGEENTGSLPPTGEWVSGPLETSSDGDDVTFSHEEDNGVGLLAPPSRSIERRKWKQEQVVTLAWCNKEKPSLEILVTVEYDGYALSISCRARFWFINYTSLALEYCPVLRTPSGADIMYGDSVALAPSPSFASAIFTDSRLEQKYRKVENLFLPQPAPLRLHPGPSTSLPFSVALPLSRVKGDSREEDGGPREVRRSRGRSFESDRGKRKFQTRHSTSRGPQDAAGLSSPSLRDSSSRRCSSASQASHPATNRDTGRGRKRPGTRRHAPRAKSPAPPAVVAFPRFHSFSHTGFLLKTGTTAGYTREFAILDPKRPARRGLWGPSWASGGPGPEETRSQASTSRPRDRNGSASDSEWRRGDNGRSGRDRRRDSERGRRLSCSTSRRAGPNCREQERSGSRDDAGEDASGGEEETASVGATVDVGLAPGVDLVYTCKRLGPEYGSPTVLTFAPKQVIINRSPFSIEYKQLRASPANVEVLHPGQAKHLVWPMALHPRLLCVRRSLSLPHPAFFLASDLSSPVLGSFFRSPIFCSHPLCSSIAAATAREGRGFASETRQEAGELPTTARRAQTTGKDSPQLSQFCRDEDEVPWPFGRPSSSFSARLPESSPPEGSAFSALERRMFIERCITTLCTLQGYRNLWSVPLDVSRRLDEQLTVYSKPPDKTLEQSVLSWRSPRFFSLSRSSNPPSSLASPTTNANHGEGQSDLSHALASVLRFETKAEGGDGRKEPSTCSSWERDSKETTGETPLGFLDLSPSASLKPRQHVDILRVRVIERDGVRFVIVSSPFSFPSRRRLGHDLFPLLYPAWNAPLSLQSFSRLLRHLLLPEVQAASPCRLLVRLRSMRRGRRNDRLVPEARLTGDASSSNEAAVASARRTSVDEREESAVELKGEDEAQQELPWETEPENELLPPETEEEETCTPRLVVTNKLILPLFLNQKGRCHGRVELPAWSSSAFALDVPSGSQTLQVAVKRTYCAYVTRPASCIRFSAHPTNSACQESHPVQQKGKGGATETGASQGGGTRADRGGSVGDGGREAGESSRLASHRAEEKSPRADRKKAEAAARGENTHLEAATHNHREEQKKRGSFVSSLQADLNLSTCRRAFSGRAGASSPATSDAEYEKWNAGRTTGTKKLQKNPYAEQKGQEAHMGDGCDSERQGARREKAETKNASDDNALSPSLVPTHEAHPGLVVNAGSGDEQYNANVRESCREPQANAEDQEDLNRWQALFEAVEEEEASQLLDVDLNAEATLPFTFTFAFLAVNPVGDAALGSGRIASGADEDATQLDRKVELTERFYEPSAPDTRPTPQLESRSRSVRASCVASGTSSASSVSFVESSSLMPSADEGGRCSDGSLLNPSFSRDPFMRETQLSGGPASVDFFSRPRQLEQSKAENKTIADEEEEHLEDAHPESLRNKEFLERRKRGEGCCEGEDDEQRLEKAGSLSDTLRAKSGPRQSEDGAFSLLPQEAQCLQAEGEQGEAIERGCPEVEQEARSVLSEGRPCQGEEGQEPGATCNSLSTMSVLLHLPSRSRNETSEHQSVLRRPKESAEWPHKSGRREAGSEKDKLRSSGSLAPSTGDRNETPSATRSLLSSRPEPPLASASSSSFAAPSSASSPLSQAGVFVAHAWVARHLLPSARHLLLSRSSSWQLFSYVGSVRIRRQGATVSLSLSGRIFPRAPFHPPPVQLSLSLLSSCLPWRSSPPVGGQREPGPSPGDREGESDKAKTAKTRGGEATAPGGARRVEEDGQEAESLPSRKSRERQGEEREVRGHKTGRWKARTKIGKSRERKVDGLPLPPEAALFPLTPPGCPLALGPEYRRFLWISILQREEERDTQCPSSQRLAGPPFALTERYVSRCDRFDASSLLRKRQKAAPKDAPFRAFLQTVAVSIQFKAVFVNLSLRPTLSRRVRSNQPSASPAFASSSPLDGVLCGPRGLSRFLSASTQVPGGCCPCASFPSFSSPRDSDLQTDRPGHAGSRCELNGFSPSLGGDRGDTRSLVCRSQHVVVVTEPQVCPPVQLVFTGLGIHSYPVREVSAEPSGSTGKPCVSSSLALTRAWEEEPRRSIRSDPRNRLSRRFAAWRTIPSAERRRTLSLLLPSSSVSPGRGDTRKGPIRRFHLTLASLDVFCHSSPSPTFRASPTSLHHVLRPSAAVSPGFPAPASGETRGASRGKAPEGSFPFVWRRGEEAAPDAQSRAKETTKESSGLLPGARGNEGRRDDHGNWRAHNEAELGRRRESGDERQREKQAHSSKGSGSSVLFFWRGREPGQSASRSRLRAAERRQEAREEAGKPLHSPSAFSSTTTKEERDSRDGDAPAFNRGKNRQWEKGSKAGGTTPDPQPAVLHVLVDLQFPAQNGDEADAGEEEELLRCEGQAMAARFFFSPFSSERGAVSEGGGLTVSLLPAVLDGRRRTSARSTCRPHNCPLDAVSVIVPHQPPVFLPSSEAYLLSLLRVCVSSRDNSGREGNDPNKRRGASSPRPCPLSRALLSRLLPLLLDGNVRRVTSWRGSQATPWPPPASSGAGPYWDFSAAAMQRPTGIPRESLFHAVTGATGARWREELWLNVRHCVLSLSPLTMRLDFNLLFSVLEPLASAFVGQYSRFTARAKRAETFLTSHPESWCTRSSPQDPARAHEYSGRAADGWGVCEDGRSRNDPASVSGPGRRHPQTLQNGTGGLLTALSLAETPAWCKLTLPTERDLSRAIHFSIDLLWVKEISLNLSVLRLFRVVTFNEAEFRWTPLQVRTTWIDVSGLLALFADHYQRQLQQQWYQMLLSFDLVGQPLSRIRQFWNSLFRGVLDLAPVDLSYPFAGVDEGVYPYTSFNIQKLLALVYYTFSFQIARFRNQPPPLPPPILKVLSPPVPLPSSSFMSPLSPLSPTASVLPESNASPPLRLPSPAVCSATRQSSPFALLPSFSASPFLTSGSDDRESLAFMEAGEEDAQAASEKEGDGVTWMASGPEGSEGALAENRERKEGRRGLWTEARRLFVPEGLPLSSSEGEQATISQSQCTVPGALFPPPLFSFGAPRSNVFFPSFSQPQNRAVGHSERPFVLPSMSPVSASSSFPSAAPCSLLSPSFSSRFSSLSPSAPYPHPTPVLLPSQLRPVDRDSSEPTCSEAVAFAANRLPFFASSGPLFSSLSSHLPSQGGSRPAQLGRETPLHRPVASALSLQRRNRETQGRRDREPPARTDKQKRRDKEHRRDTDSQRRRDRDSQGRRDQATGERLSSREVGISRDSHRVATEAERRCSATGRPSFPRNSSPPHPRTAVSSGGVSERSESDSRPTERWRRQEKVQAREKQSRFSQREDGVEMGDRKARSARSSAWLASPPLADKTNVDGNRVSVERQDRPRAERPKPKRRRNLGSGAGEEGGTGLGGGQGRQSVSGRSKKESSQRPEREACMAERGNPHHESKSWGSTQRRGLPTKARKTSRVSSSDRDSRFLSPDDTCVSLSPDVERDTELSAASQRGRSSSLGETHEYRSASSKDDIEDGRERKCQAKRSTPSSSASLSPEKRMTSVGMNRKETGDNRDSEPQRDARVSSSFPASSSSQASAASLRSSSPLLSSGASPGEVQKSPKSSVRETAEEQKKSEKQVDKEAGGSIVGAHVPQRLSELHRDISKENRKHHKRRRGEREETRHSSGEKNSLRDSRPTRETGAVSAASGRKMSSCQSTSSASGLAASCTPASPASSLSCPLFPTPPPRRISPSAASGCFSPLHRSRNSDAQPRASSRGEPGEAECETEQVDMKEKRQQGDKEEGRSKDARGSREGGKEGRPDARPWEERERRGCREAAARSEDKRSGRQADTEQESLWSSFYPAAAKVPDDLLGWVPTTQQPRRSSGGRRGSSDV